MKLPRKECEMERDGCPFTFSGDYTLDGSETLSHGCLQVAINCVV